MAEEKILIRVQKLLDKANANGTTEAERQLLLDKADELMIKHAIDEAMLMATMTKEERRKPINERFYAADPYAPHWEKFRTVLLYIGKLHRVRMAFYQDGDVMLVGFREDVEYTKMKWLNVYLHFSKTLDPRWDTALTPEHNVYNFKVAGVQWQDIQCAAAMAGIDKPFHWFKPAYRRHCKFLGEEPTRHTQRNFAYRESFAEAFRSRICQRVDELMESRDKMASEAGALVAVKDLGIEIDEMFYDLFPHRRPMTAAERLKAQEELDRINREMEEKHQRWLESLSPEQRRDYDREQERLARQAAKDNAEYWKQQERLYDNAGARSGVASADKVDLNRRAATDAAPKRGEL